MCLAVPGRIVSVGEGESRRGRAASTSAASSRKSAWPSCPRRVGRLRPRPRRLRDHARRRGRGAKGLRVPEGDRRSRKGALVKFVDEYRDAAAVRRLAKALAHVATRPWTLMEVCGGQTHAIVRFGLDALLPPECHADPRTGLPGLRHPDRADRQRGRDRRAAGGRSSARSATCCACPAARQDLLTVKAEGGDVRDRLLAARRAGDWPAERPDAQVVFFAVGFETTAPANAMAVYQARREGISQLLAARVARPRAAGHARHPVGAGEPRPGLPRRRPRLHRDGLRGIRAASRASTTCRSWSPASSRVDILEGVLSVRPAARGGTGRGREPVRPLGRREGNPAAQRLMARGLPRRAAALARHRRDRRERPRALPRPTAASTPSAASACARSEPKSLRVPQRRGPARAPEARRLPRVRRALHARASPRRAHGLVGGRLRRLLPLPAGVAARGWGTERGFLLQPARVPRPATTPRRCWPTAAAAA